VVVLAFFVIYPVAGAHSISTWLVRHSIDAGTATCAACPGIAGQEYQDAKQYVD